LTTLPDSPFDLRPEGLSIRISLTPKAGANSIDGIAPGPDGPVLKVRITAVPEKGKANKALIKLLAKQTGVASGRLQVVSGMTSRKKCLMISAGDEDLLSQLVEWSKSL